MINNGPDVVVDETFLDEVDVLEQPELKPISKARDVIVLPTKMPTDEELAGMGKNKRDADSINADFVRRFGAEVGYRQMRLWLKAEIADAPVLARKFSRITRLSDLHRKYTELREPVIDGLLRRGEIMNIISAPKVGKSFIANDLATTIAQGSQWFGKFDTVSGRVLIIDNELHPETISFRTKLVAKKKAKTEIGIKYLASRIDVISLRGELVDLKGLAREIKHIARGEYALIILDAFYRFLPPRTDENDNGQIAGLYNRLDKYAEKTDSAICIIHHTSKGNQAGKKVTDVGSGAGVQSRATDTHLVLLPHKTKGVVILDAAVRSFRPMEKFCIKSDFPIWKYDPTSNPEEFEGSGEKGAGQAVRDMRDGEKGRLLASLTLEMTIDDMVRKATELGLKTLNYGAVTSALNKIWIPNRMVREVGRRGRKALYVNASVQVPKAAEENPLPNTQEVLDIPAQENGDNGAQTIQ